MTERSTRQTGKNRDPERIAHTFGPCCDSRCRILILGTMPSPKSREQGFYYGHPQNLFWKTLSDVLGQEEPEPSVEARRAFALKNHVALWDVLESCRIQGADDSSIREAVPVDLWKIFETAPEIRAVFTTGKKAKELYDKYKEEMYRNCPGRERLEAVYLPSTSPANRGVQKTDRYRELWAQVADALKDG